MIFMLQLRLECLPTFCKLAVKRWSKVHSGGFGLRGFESLHSHKDNNNASLGM